MGFARTVGIAAASIASAAPQVECPAYMHDAAHSAFSPAATAIAPASTLSLQYVFQESKIKKQLVPRFRSWCST